MASGAALDAVLETITTAAVDLSTGGRCAIMAIDHDDRLQHVTASPLPEFYLRATQGISVKGTAAEPSRGRVVMRDILTEPDWAPLHAVARAADLRGSWTQPIVDASGAPVGTFCLLYRDAHVPGDVEQDLLDLLSRLTSIAFQQASVADGGPRARAHEDAAGPAPVRLASGWPRTARPDRIAAGTLVVDVLGCQVHLDGRPINLSACEFGLLVFLATHPGRVFSREEILAAVWGSTSPWLSVATVTEHVYRLRRKLSPSGATLIRTVRGFGYRFDTVA